MLKAAGGRDLDYSQHKPTRTNKDQGRTQLSHDGGL